MKNKEIISSTSNVIGKVEVVSNVIMCISISIFIYSIISDNKVALIASSAMFMSVLLHLICEVLGMLKLKAQYNADMFALINYLKVTYSNNEIPKDIHKLLLDKATKIIENSDNKTSSLYAKFITSIKGDIEISEDVQKILLDKALESISTNWKIWDKMQLAVCH